ncbi:DUF5392 family protein [Alteribacillus iranensis]|uniref:DUF5392 family protein n=1 Tax=Alteribacillus iranensis TaxID=930128 RepID=A0A1I2EVQ4_9BACI|nr:DUF5392 family protein [Alteribacillus iranensis]SFE96925.1 hypothetical protein SAMN05192532_10731 [Alteribacillus iranensis]
MNPFYPKDTPTHVKKEFDHLQSKLAPFFKKSMIYGAVAAPMLFFSLFNLYFLTTSAPLTRETAIVIGLFALAGAFSMALIKESFHQNKEIQKTSIKYMEERIKKSTILEESAQRSYLNKIAANPTQTYHIFYEFLEHEQRMKQFMRER